MEEKLSLATNIEIKRESQPSLIKEAFKITLKNGRLVFFISSILFFYYYLMGLADYVFLAPVLKDYRFNSARKTKNGSGLTTAGPTIDKATLKDVRFIIDFKFVELSFFCLVLTFSAAASVHSTYEAYKAKQLGLRDMLCGLRGKIGRPLKTTIWMILINLATVFLLYIAVGVIVINTEDHLSILLHATVVLILSFIYYIYFFALWMLSLVVSVLDENMSGLKAIYQANELMKDKRLHGFGLMAFLIFVSFAMLVAFALIFLAATYKVAFLGTAIINLMIWTYCLMKVFGFAVFTLFYHECKKSHQAKEIPHPYAPVPAAIAEV